MPERLVRRVRDAVDGRAVAVELTAEGHALVESTVDELLRHGEDLLSGLDPQQRVQLTALLRVLPADPTCRAGAADRP